jgi:Rieske Fe-S protein
MDHVDLLIVGNKGIAGVKGNAPRLDPRRRSPSTRRCDVLIARTVTQSLDEVRKNEGGIVSSGGRKVAVYRDKKGHTVALNPKCTHMGARSAGNSGDQDVGLSLPRPSRYSPTGEVINGPATKPLEKTDL